MMQVDEAFGVLAADFAGFGRALDGVLQGEVVSFQGQSGQYGLLEDVDALLARIEGTRHGLAVQLEAMEAASPADAARQAQALAARLGLLDTLLEQLDRYAIVADLRGATQASGDLLKKLRNWVATLREWLASIRRQAMALGGDG